MKEVSEEVLNAKFYAENLTHSPRFVSYIDMTDSPRLRVKTRIGRTSKASHMLTAKTIRLRSTPAE